MNFAALPRIPVLVLCVAVGSLWGCKEQARPPLTQPAAPESSAPSAIAPAPPAAVPTKPPEPKRPPHPWVIVRDAEGESHDGDVKAEWTGGNRLEIRTENVRLLTLDLNKLPEDAPRKGPWTLQIDKQGIEIYGRPGMRVLDRARSRNGDWSVVPDSHRTRP